MLLWLGGGGGSRCRSVFGGRSWVPLMLSAATDYVSFKATERAEATASGSVLPGRSRERTPLHAPLLWGDFRVSLLSCGFHALPSIRLLSTEVLFWAVLCSTVALPLSL